MFAAACIMVDQPDFNARREDWRIGPVVYQVFVDRFAPSADLEAKISLYPSPKRLMKWSDHPKPHQDANGNWTHVYDFWGGDLPSLISKFDYISNLGVDVLYLNPIFEAESNHKYDTIDYRSISPEFGTKQDFERLIDTTHKAGMKLILDGVFNHMGDKSTAFVSAKNDPDSSYRNWFVFDKSLPNGYSAWAGVKSLPQLNLENREIRQKLWLDQDSVVQSYLKQGIDGWRLDVAFELGHTFLREITESAHNAKPGSLVLGEIAGYPVGWFPDVDGVYNLTAMDLVRDMVSQKTDGGRTGQMMQDMVNDAGVENLLRS